MSSFLNKKFIDALLETKDFKNALYATLKHSFLYHSNKIEGSTFTAEALALLLDKNVVTGKHTFEIIHPFQDGNGRIGRFLMLKQMLENELPVKIVSWDSEDLYRESLNQCDLENQEPLKAYMDSLEDFRETYKEFWRR